MWQEQWDHLRSSSIPAWNLDWNLRKLKGYENYGFDGISGVLLDLKNNVLKISGWYISGMDSCFTSLKCLLKLNHNILSRIWNKKR